MLPDQNDVFHNGHFHGQYISFAMDQLSISLTTLSNLSDRRIDRFMDSSNSNNLPAFLCAEKPGLRLGFMGGQFMATSITAEIAALIPEGKVLGVDSSPNMIHLARKSFQLPNIEFQCVKAEELLTSDVFDNIFCFNCLLWIREPEKALNRLSKLLKPGGKFVILTYLKESSYVDFLEKRLERFPAYKKLSAARTMLTLEAYRAILESNNLRIESIETLDSNYYYSSVEEFLLL